MRTRFHSTISPPSILANTAATTWLSLIVDVFHVQGDWRMALPASLARLACNTVCNSIVFLYWTDLRQTQCLLARVAKVVIIQQLHLQSSRWCHHEPKLPDVANFSGWSSWRQTWPPAYKGSHSRSTQQQTVLRRRLERFSKNGQTKSKKLDFLQYNLNSLIFNYVLGIQWYSSVYL